MRLHYKDINMDKVHQLGYTYFKKESGLLSLDTITCINTSTHLVSLSLNSKNSNAHLDNIRELVKYGAISIATLSSYDGDAVESKKLCICGGSLFTASQTCRHDITVDGTGCFHADVGINDSEEPYGPYCCTKCGIKYDGFYQLKHVKASAFKTFCHNGVLRLGDLVLLAMQDKTNTLRVGMVKKIKHNFPASDGSAMEDDVTVNFAVQPYLQKNIDLIYSALTKLHNSSNVLNDQPALYSVLGPSSLIRITGLDEEKICSIITSIEAADDFCRSVKKVDNAYRPHGERLKIILTAVPSGSGFSPIRLKDMLSELTSDADYTAIEFAGNDMTVMVLSKPII